MRLQVFSRHATGREPKAEPRLLRANLTGMTMTERLLEATATDDSAGVTEEELDAGAAALGIELPEDYRAVMRRINGGECDFGESWIVLQSLEAAIERNATFKEAGFPPFIFFGSDGGGEGR